MDLGVVGLDGLVGSNTGFVSLASDPEPKHKWYGSGFNKQERSGTTEDEWRSSKLAKTDDISASKAMLLQQRNSLLRSNATLFSDGQHQNQMLSFSSPKSEPLLVDKATPNATLPYSYHPFSSYSRNTGYSSGIMHGVNTGARGPFTPSQWMELEHQALIYKYISANVPVPSHLLIPIRKALDSAGFCNFSTGLLRPNALGWGGFHLGYSNNTDPEPGRCRRTDGKKWRCSRDAVVDQKYCERHMNRGRHRSRKPVEGQSGHALTGTTTTTTTITPNSSKLIPNNNASSSSLSIVVPGNSASNSLTFAHQEPKNMHQPLASDASVANTINRMFMNNKESNASERMQDGPALPMLPPTLELKPKENHFMIEKQQFPYEESSKSNEFGFVTSDSLLNPSQKSSTLLTSRSFGSSQNPINRDTESQHSLHSLRHFIDDCPKTQSNNHHHRSGGVSWPELDMQSDRTQLSISIPMSSSDFMSFTSSPTNEKLTLSPLRLSRELDPIQMGLGVGVGSGLNESNTRQANWIPITWESSMGGPLGEVLHLSNNNNNASDQCVKNSSALNLMTDGWDNSPPLGSSPTGVLQKTAFGSLSHSSAGSSPRAENKTQEGASFCNDLLGSTLGNASSSLP
ncbi:growth-regulating factor 1-like [Gastrolobium bilobum]|uniref:growth-regulating factor 1-like n=1 Tax=Gastrolobium bilobum TaxID=150636 RepID=UPI002AB16CC7|nr:growth-regulating factor 1-like [Gastrolobium bilobum]